MATVREASVEVNGAAGAIIRAMDDAKKLPFTKKAEELGRQIADDCGVSFETGEVEDETTLSPRAERLLAELKDIKLQVLFAR